MKKIKIKPRKAEIPLNPKLPVKLNYGKYLTK